MQEKKEFNLEKDFEEIFEKEFKRKELHQKYLDTLIDVLVALQPTPQLVNKGQKLEMRLS